MKKSLWCLFGFSAFLLALCVAWSIYSTDHPVNRWSFSRIHKGMARAEAEAILGEPCFRCYPRDRSATPGIPDADGAFLLLGWIQNDTCFIVKLDEDYVVCGSFMEYTDNRTAFERIWALIAGIPYCSCATTPGQ